LFSKTSQKNVKDYKFIGLKLHSKPVSSKKNVVKIYILTWARRIVKEEKAGLGNLEVELKF